MGRTNKILIERNETVIVNYLSNGDIQNTQKP